jgi:hypothetical protein
MGARTAGGQSSELRNLDLRLCGGIDGGVDHVMLVWLCCAVRQAVMGIGILAQWYLTYFLHTYMHTYIRTKYVVHTHGAVLYTPTHPYTQHMVEAGVEWGVCTMGGRVACARIHSHRVSTREEIHCIFPPGWTGTICHSRTGQDGHGSHGWPTNSNSQAKEQTSR